MRRRLAEERFENTVPKRGVLICVGLRDVVLELIVAAISSPLFMRADLD